MTPVPRHRGHSAITQQRATGQARGKSLLPLLGAGLGDPPGMKYPILNLNDPSPAAPALDYDAITPRVIPGNSSAKILLLIMLSAMALTKFAFMDHYITHVGRKGTNDAPEHAEHLRQAASVTALWTGGAHARSSNHIGFG